MTETVCPYCQQFGREACPIHASPDDRNWLDAKLDVAYTVIRTAQAARYRLDDIAHGRPVKESWGAFLRRCWRAYRGRAARTPF